MDDGEYLHIRCKNEDAHLWNGQVRDGNIAAFIGKDDMLLRCPDWKCKQWIRLQFNFGGLEVDLRQSGIIQGSVKSGAFNLKCRKASVLIDG